jgi:hypothetical protein
MNREEAAFKSRLFPYIPRCDRVRGMLDFKQEIFQFVRSNWQGGKKGS